jgi:two-component system sensor histidine kinase CreC
LVDISRVLAAIIETDVREGRIDPQRLRSAITQVYRKRFAARVYALEKSNVDLRVYVTDRSGQVVFDSQGRDEGKDYSRWRDVLLTLRGEYGARTTRDTAGDPDSSVMFVASPVVWNGELAGVLSVGKPTANLNAFARLTKHKIIVAGATAIAGLMGACAARRYLAHPAFRPGARLPAPGA